MKYNNLILKKKLIKFSINNLTIDTLLQNNF